MGGQAIPVGGAFEQQPGGGVDLVFDERRAVAYQRHTACGFVDLQLQDTGRRRDEIAGGKRRSTRAEHRDGREGGGCFGAGLRRRAGAAEIVAQGGVVIAVDVAIVG